MNQKFHTQNHCQCNCAHVQIHVAYRDRKKAEAIKYVKTATAKVRWYNTKHREGGDVHVSRRRYVLLELL